MPFSDTGKPPQALSQKIRIFFMPNILIKQYWISHNILAMEAKPLEQKYEGK